MMKTYNIERNITLKAKTSEYIAAYRALTPKFNPIDLTGYNSFKFQAKGTGTLISEIGKRKCYNWETQYKTSVNLTEDITSYIYHFQNSNRLMVAIRC